MEIEYKREALTPKQMNEIYKEVYTNHEWVFKGRKIKYVDVAYDNRTCSIFYVTFRNTIEGTKVFATTNRTEQHDIFLFDEIMKWLVEGRDK